MKWYWWALIIVVVLAIIVLYRRMIVNQKSTQTHTVNADGTSKTVVTTPDKSLVIEYDKNGNTVKAYTIAHPAIRIANIKQRNTQDNNPNGIASASYYDTKALTDSNGVTAVIVHGKPVVNGIEMLKCCNAVNASCHCTGWTWQPPSNCDPPSCLGLSK